MTYTKAEETLMRQSVSASRFRLKLWMVLILLVPSVGLPIQVLATRSDNIYAVGFALVFASHMLLALMFMRFRANALELIHKLQADAPSAVSAPLR